MSVIGLDFGSHVSSIALWFEDKDVVEVIADDLGSRTIPSFVGFRSGEVIVGEAALSQYHKNASNTFQDVRSMILDPEIKNVFIPVLEKEVLVQEVVSHYFRNIHNQIKQQVGKAVRECILSIPMTLDDSIKERLFEAAQSGGIRIKSIINNSSSSLLAYQFDDSSITSAQVMVIDVGWSLTEASVTTVSGGLFFPLSKSSSTSICGKVLVNLLADHCAKDFQRKAKVLCSDNSKSMMRLRRECEESMKHLSTGQESTIDIDSLCEGIDYSSKISRARFEDLASIPFMRLKNLVNEVLDSASLTVENISHVCIIGGLSAMPKVIQTIKGIFPNALYPRGKFESNETQCIGAALYGKYLFQQVY
jgi:L1 cell adhesion molecule like protein